MIILETCMNYNIPGSASKIECDTVKHGYNEAPGTGDIASL